MEQAINIMEGIRQQKDCTGVVMGGDFNVPLFDCNLLRDVDGAVFQEYKIPSHRTDRGYEVIDYVLVWPRYRFQLRSAAEVAVNPKHLDTMHKAYNHALIHYKITFKPRAPKVTRGTADYFKLALNQGDFCKLRAITDVLTATPSSESNVIQKIKTLNIKKIKNARRIMCQFVADRYNRDRQELDKRLVELVDCGKKKPPLIKGLYQMYRYACGEGSADEVPDCVQTLENNNEAPEPSEPGLSEEDAPLDHAVITDLTTLRESFDTFERNVKCKLEGLESKVQALEAEQAHLRENLSPNKAKGSTKSKT